MKMIDDLIFGIIYTEFDDILGPNPFLWEPSKLAQHIRKLVSVKTMTLLAGEEDFIPKKLVIVPFPSLNMKALIKYIEWKDDSRRAGYGWASITVLFKEFNDLIFYKYKDDLKPAFKTLSKKISESEDLRSNKNNLAIEFKIFYNSIIKILEDLRKKELSAQKAEEFPKIANDIDYKFKLAVCGDPSVGKTSAILRFTDNAFTRTYIPTIGVNITEKNVRVGNKLIQLIVWDIAGQSKFRPMREHFYKGTEGLFLVFDLTLRTSYDNIPNWYQDIRKNLKTSKNLIALILGNKNDLIKERVISKEEAFVLADNLNMEFIETSALTGDNVNNAFYKIAERLLSKNEF